MGNQSEENLGHTSFRKLAHLEICLDQEVEARKSPGWEDVHFVHRAMPEIDWEELNTEVELWGKKLSMPLISAAMTGGHPDVREVNEIIARAAQDHKFGMGVGSERAAIEKDISYITESFKVVRDLAPDALLIGNLGMAQFSDRGGYGAKEARQAIDLISADVLAIHTNPAQEVVQMEGDTFFKGSWNNACKTAEAIDTPIIMKEVGSGFGKEEAQMIENSPISGLDIGGCGGTSWVGVEALRALGKNDLIHHDLGQLFWDWGFTTAVSIIETRSATQKPLIATGGVRNGLQAAKALALGADAVGMALPFLKAAKKGEKELTQFIEKFRRELMTAMFLTGSRTIADLRKTPLLITGKSREWLAQRKIDFCSTRKIL